jgi:hypothetical protein
MCAEPIHWNIHISRGAWLACSSQKELSRDAYMTPARSLR